jgi:4-hydroxy-tetrahydrodipicolinate synthase
MNTPVFGSYVTMITPYNQDGTVDFGAVEALVEWYFNRGCNGIFAVCQSSEIFFLSLADRVKIAQTVRRKADELALKDKSRGPMAVVVSGHIAYDRNEQLSELYALAATGPDALILISNRMDIPDNGDDAWISDTDMLITKLPDDMPLGVYECPTPYKRLMSDKMLSWCAHTGRFYFMKDTCCNAAQIARRVKLIEGTPMKLLNANGQTLLETLRSGAWGYCGIMCNFHPGLFAWLCANFKSQPETADIVQSFIGIAAFTESLAYPVTAKYHLSEFEGVPMTLISRSRDCRELTDYHKSCIHQMKLLADTIYAGLKK